ncbi:hypothetical protein HO173_006360 [Letharia columbiana]|uniref:Uncharacterized protein n=1 Tax=Letharia columbiana TaxID=112416 RepID=A0A8H6FVP9_9LECA|nr:uncharacterized protein HO173_006360 [Letharia columbiana]KAF6235677.1 hypothetical protein HO173_006360 [Letharia columbiana]
MKLHSFLTCIASLALCDPVAGASSWAFDPDSCNQRHLAVLQPALERATTIAKNTATWLPKDSIFKPSSARSKPKFAQALLGSNHAKYARSVFGGGKIGWSGDNIDIPGIAGFTGRMDWTDPSARRPYSPTKNLAIYCNANNVGGSGNIMSNQGNIRQSYAGSRLTAA